jgi:hypothetical protein
MQQVSLLIGNSSLAFNQSQLLRIPSLLLNRLLLLRDWLWIRANCFMGSLVNTFKLKKIEELLEIEKIILTDSGVTPASMNLEKWRLYES